MSDPLGIELDNAFNLKIMRDVEFLQSYQDCEQFVTSLGVEPDLATQVLHSLHLGPDNLFPVFIVG